LEQAYRSALAHHVHWPARLGSPMLISEIWYDAVLAVPAHAQQDDLDRKATALEQSQQDGSSTGRPSLNCQG
jgi:hypothetical protein